MTTISLSDHELLRVSSVNHVHNHSFDNVKHMDIDDDHSEVDGEVKVVVNSMADPTLIGVSPVTATSSDDSQLDISLELGRLFDDHSSIT